MKNNKKGLNTTLIGNKCFRCDHEWLPRNLEIPAVCPKCKSPYWSRPRKNQNSRPK